MREHTPARLRLGDPPAASAIADTLDRPLRDLRISVTDRCNQRCPYCMPREQYGRHHRFLRSDQQLSFAEILRLARVFVRLGVRKVRLTGGEPLLRTGLSELVEGLAQLPGIEDLALTTNGQLLVHHAAALRAAGLQRVSISLDSLEPAVIARMTGGRGRRADVLAGIALARELRLEPVKVNAVIKRGLNDHAALELAEHFRHSGVILRFIEYMDVGTQNLWHHDQVVASADLMAQIHARWPLQALSANYDAEVAARYRYLDGGGEIGFISAVTRPVCAQCSRARLTADGTLFGCLFAPQGLDLRSALRAGVSDEQLDALVREFWAQRADRYSELRGRTDQTARGIDMHRMGG